MKAIKTGNIYQIYDDEMKTFDQLPAQTYCVRFSKMSGFFLERRSDLKVKETKVYGVHNTKVNKVFKTFEAFIRNLGVILSGDKGMGKSMFANMLAEGALEKGIPVIIVDSFIPGIASFIESIEQEVLVLFDEFDKTFGGVKVGDNEANPQDSMLGLFDGMSAGKKLFVVTCNDLKNMSDYLINRPGRFHFHFRFDYPTPEEIKEYLQDKLERQYWEEIEKVISFSFKINLNYDCLRAIVYELNSGEKFEEAIKDLNIVSLHEEYYNAALYFEDGTVLKSTAKIDLFNTNADETVYVTGRDIYSSIGVKFNTSDCRHDMNKGATIVMAGDFTIIYDEDEEEETKEFKKLKPLYLSITSQRDRNIHYTV